MVKVLLINPQRNLRNPKTQYTSVPIGLISLASFLQINGYHVEVLDTIGEDIKNWELQPNGVYRCGMSNNKILRCIEAYKPDVVGISANFTPRFSNVVEIAKLVKQYNYDCPVVVGGMHATVCADDVLKEQAIDFCIMGEAEIPVLTLLNKLGNKDIDYTDLKAVSYRQDGQSIISKDRTLIDKLDTLPIPAYDTIPMEKYFRSGMKRNSLTQESRQVSMITSRGCPCNCTFCSSQHLWGNICRQRSAMHVLTEIEVLLEGYGVKEISFEDDNISLNSDRLGHMCSEIVHRNMKFKWSTPNGIAINGMDLKLIRIMKRAGCYMLNFGIESGDESMLKDIMMKNIDLAKVKEVIGICHDEGIVTLGYFVLGMPGETAESLERTIAFAKSLKLDEIGLFIATPFPFTGLESSSKKSGYLKKDFRAIVAEDDIESEIMLETPMLPTEKLLYYKDLFMKEFYMQKVKSNPLYYANRVLKQPNLVRKIWKKG